MRIIIHRGTHQIGGCATEICTQSTRVFVDFGAELDNKKAAPLKINGVSTGKTNCDGVFFTHYHGDHIGLMDSINSDIPLYIGEFAKKTLTLLNGRTKGFDDTRLENMRTFSADRAVQVKDIKITPFWVDHSAYDAYMFLIEADGKRVLHTGDFRTRGFRGKGFEKTLRKYIGHIDALICEGTLLSRNGYTVKTEHNLQLETEQMLNKEKCVFAVCSSTNTDRLTSFCSSVPKGKYCLCDSYQRNVIDAAREYAEKYSSLYGFPKLLTYSDNLDKKMKMRGFCMFVRLGNKYHKSIIDKFREYDPLIAYSMWGGYLDEEKAADFVNGCRIEQFHTSGHADINSLKLLIEITTPNKIIPIHTETPEKFKQLAIGRNICYLSDKETIDI